MTKFVKLIGCFLLLLIAQPVFGVTITVDGIKYDIDTSTKEATCTGPTQSFEDVIIPDYVTYNSYDYPVTKIGDNAFDEKDITGTLTLGKNITAIGKQAFYDTKIKGTLIIPNSVTKIEYEAFFYCSNLTTLVIGKSVTDIGEYIYGGRYNVYTGGAFKGCSGLERIICLATKAPKTWNHGYYNRADEYPNFSYYNVKLYIPSDFSGDGSCSFYNSSYGTINSPGEWSYFANRYVLEDSEFAGYLDGTYGDNNGDKKEDGYQEADITSVVYMVPDEERQLGDLIPDVSVSSWESSNEDIAEVNKNGRVDAWEFGRCYIAAKDADGETVAVFEVFVCPTVTIEHGMGVVYQHHVIYNSTPSLFIAAPQAYVLSGVTHDGDDITDHIADNDGNYTPSTPITKNSTINVALKSASEDDIVTNVDPTLTSTTKVRVLVFGREVRIQGAEENARVTVYDSAGGCCYQGTDKTITVSQGGFYIIEVEGVNDAIFKIIVI